MTLDRLVSPLLLSLAALCLASTAPLAHAQVGLGSMTPTIADPSPEAPAATSRVPVLVWYPTAAAATTQAMGPFRFAAALGAPPSPGRAPMVVISHGTGGTELGHAWLAEGLVRAGFVVVTLRHPGDNWEDRSAVRRTDYFVRRPAQAARVLDAVLANPTWAERIDASRIAVIGHSAGGHVALALAGGEPSVERVLAHCVPGGAGLREDAVMCGLGGRRDAAESPSMQAGTASASAMASVSALPDALPGPSTTTAPARTRDPRIRAGVAMAPLGIAFAPESLAKVDVPVMVEVAVRDEVLNPRFHGDAACAAIPGARCVRSAAAGHHAAFQAGTGPLPSPAGDPSVDPAGFDRAAWQAEALPRIVGFLKDALR
jgi:predicted dienelactone hydrolase